ncbi:MAG: DoxX family protein [Brevibacterium sp.]
MNTITIIVVILAAAWIGFSAVSILMQRAFLVDYLVDYGVPKSWWPWLGVAKAVGAVGLLVGLAFPLIGVAASVGLVLYFIGALITVARARSCGHLPFPLMYLLPALAAGWLLALA